MIHRQIGYRRRLTYIVLGAILFLTSYSDCFGQSPSFPMNHWVYSFLDRMQTKGMVENFLPGIRPYSRAQIAQALAPIMKNNELRRRLNGTELEQLQFLKLEFKEELSDLEVDVGKVRAPRLTYLRRNTFLQHILPDFVLQNHRNLFTVESGKLYLNGDFVLKYHINPENYSYKKDRTLQQEKRGIHLWGKWGNYVQYYFDFRDATEWGGEYPDFDNNWSFDRVGYAQAREDHVSFDETTSGLWVGHGFWQVMIGKEKNRWGPGRFGSLALSNWATSYDQFKIQLHWPHIRFTAFTGFMRSYPPIIRFGYETEAGKRAVRANKYLAAHRIEFSPWKRLIVGIHETLIYGERNLELAYFNPINFYWSAEHYLGDQDNAALGFDFILYPGYDMKFYGELFLDDMRTGKIASDWYGNKWAFLLGLSSVDLFRLPNLDFHVEWSRIRPFIYTHKYPVNVYKHFTATLGHWAGPNSETVSATLEYQYSKWLLFHLFFQDYKQGENTSDTNVGGDINHPHGPEDPEEVAFLAGDVERRSTIRVGVSYELFRNAYLKFEFAGHWYENVLNDDLNRVDGSGNEWRIAASWNY